MCIAWFIKKCRRKYYYRVSHYSDDRHYYIMCNTCYKLLPKYLQKQDFNPEIDKFIFRFDDTKVLVENIIMNKNCIVCYKLNTEEFYETMNAIKIDLTK